MPWRASHRQRASEQEHAPGEGEPDHAPEVPDEVVELPDDSPRPLRSPRRPRAGASRRRTRTALRWPDDRGARSPPRSRPSPRRPLRCRARRADPKSAGRSGVSRRASEPQHAQRGPEGRQDPLDQQQADEPGDGQEGKAQLAASALGAVERGEQAQQHGRLVVRADPEREGDRQQLDQPTERAGFDSRHERRREPLQQHDREHLVDRVHRVGGLRSRVAERPERGRRDEEPHRVLAEEAAHVPAGRELGCDPARRRGLRHAGRDLGVEARVRVACAIVDRRERGPARRQDQDPRDRAARAAGSWSSRLILRRALGESARPVRG